jgi:hypothetical protein
MPALAYSPAAVLASMVLLAGCESRSYGAPPTPPPAPPPAVIAPAPDPAPAEPVAPSPVPSGKRAGKGKREREPSAPPRSEEQAAKTAPPVQAPPAPKPPPAAPSAPADKLPAAAASAKGSVRVPESAHVQIELPAGLQADLDHDPRMQAWVNKAVSAIERCYAPLRESGVTGVIEVRLVMHENERPSAEPGKLPSALTPMVACVTGGLLGVKMPLFTGKEGTRYTLKIRLAK